MQRQSVKKMTVVYSPFAKPRTDHKRRDAALTLPGHIERLNVEIADSGIRSQWRTVTWPTMRGERR